MDDLSIYRLRKSLSLRDAAWLVHVPGIFPDRIREVITTLRMARLDPDSYEAFLAEAYQCPATAELDDLLVMSGAASETHEKLKRMIGPTKDDEEVPIETIREALALLGLSLLWERELEPKKEKPLHELERKTLLRIIRALADMAGVDLTRHTKAGDALAKHAAGKFPMPEKTVIGRKLQAARDLDR